MNDSGHQNDQTGSQRIDLINAGNQGLYRISFAAWVQTIDTDVINFDGEIRVNVTCQDPNGNIRVITDPLGLGLYTTTLLDSATILLGFVGHNGEDPMNPAEFHIDVVYTGGNGDAVYSLYWAMESI